MKMPFLIFCGDGVGSSFSLSQLSTSEAIPALDSAALTSTTGAEICHKGTFSVTYDKVENTTKKGFGLQFKGDTEADGYLDNRFIKSH